MRGGVASHGGADPPAGFAGAARKGQAKGDGVGAWWKRQMAFRGRAAAAGGDLSRRRAVAQIRARRIWRVATAAGGDDGEGATVLAAVVEGAGWRC